MIKISASKREREIFWRSVFFQNEYPISSHDISGGFIDWSCFMVLTVLDSSERWWGL
jgi:hypothetical protein